MKAHLAVFAVAAAAAAQAVTITPGKVDVVIDRKAPPVVRFAAAEMTNFLSRALGAAVPVVTAPADGRIALILGENEWSRAAGIDLAGKARDTFVIRTAKDRICIAGKDHPRRNPAKDWLEDLERGTLFGVYEFLERFAGCRFYFPDELGEIVPRADRIEVAEGDVSSSPRCPIRKYYDSSADGALFAGARKDIKRMHWLRVRGASMNIPCCHGSNRFKLLEKYKDTHPEYFALRADGSRCVDFTGAPSSRHGYPCFSSGVRDAVVEECVKRFKEGAKFVDIMPNDALPECMCEKCQAAYRKDDKLNYGSEVVWGYTVHVANKLKELGIAGNVTQMAYPPYRRIPDFDIPDNVYVMIAEGGPWSVTKPDRLAAEYAEIRAWKRKLANPVWIWTYPHKYGRLQIKGVPDVAPHAWGSYFKGIAADTLGSFAESETDQWIYHYLNYYVFCRVLWDPEIDPEALIDEHHRLMFGPAAAEMKGFYDFIERKWVKEIAGNIIQTSIGPVAQPPSEHDLWMNVYSDAAIAEAGARLDRAAALVKPGSPEAKRIAFFRREYYNDLSVGSAEYRERLGKVEALKWNAGRGETVELIPFGRKDRLTKELVRTAVSARRTADALVFAFDCEEPRMDDIKAFPREHDDAETWSDTGVELFLNVACDRLNYYHLVINFNGNITDYTALKAGSGYAKGDTKWNSGATAKVERRDGGYVITVSVPLKSLGTVPDEFPVEVCRSRVTKSGEGYCLYHWSPYAQDWDEVRAFGTISFK